MLTKAAEQVKAVFRRIDWLKVAKKAGGLAFTAAAGIPSPDLIHTAICSGLHSSVGWLALIGLIRLTLAEIIAGVWLTLFKPGLRLSKTGLHSSASVHAGWD